MAALLLKEIKQEPHSPTMDEPNASETLMSDFDPATLARHIDPPPLTRGMEPPPLTRATRPPPHARVTGPPPPLTASNHSQLPMMRVNPIKKEPQDSEPVPATSAPNSQVVPSQSNVVTSLIQIGEQNYLMQNNPFFDNLVQPSIPLVQNNMFRPLVLGTNICTPSGFPVNLFNMQNQAQSVAQLGVPGNINATRMPVMLSLEASTVGSCTQSYNNAAYHVTDGGGLAIQPQKTSVEPDLEKSKEQGTKKKGRGRPRKNNSCLNSMSFESNLKKNKEQGKKKRQRSQPRKRNTIPNSPSLGTSSGMFDRPPMATASSSSVTNPFQNADVDNDNLPQIEFCYSMKKLKLKEMLEILGSGYDILKFVKPESDDDVRARILCDAAKKHHVHGIHPGIGDAFYASLMSPFIPALEICLLKADVENTLKLREEGRPKSEQIIESQENSGVTDNYVCDSGNELSEEAPGDASIACVGIDSSDISTHDQNVPLKEGSSVGKTSCNKRHVAVSEDDQTKAGSSSETLSSDESYVAMGQDKRLNQGSAVGALSGNDKHVIMAEDEVDSIRSSASQVIPEAGSAITVLSVETNSQTTKDDTCADSKTNEGEGQNRQKLILVDTLPKWKHFIALLNKFDCDIEQYCTRRTALTYSFFSCYLCPYVTSDAENGLKHIIETHWNPEKPRKAGMKFVCTHCSTVFRDLKTLKSHEIQYHLSQYPCYFCGMSNNSLMTLAKHICYCHSEVYLCNCGLEVIGKRALLKHSEKCESHFQKMKSTTCVCLYCSARFSDFCLLKYHMIVKHMNKPVPNVSEETCYSCRHVFMNAEALRTHSMLHENDMLHSVNMASVISIQRQFGWMYKSEPSPGNHGGNVDEEDTGQVPPLSFKWPWWQRYIKSVEGSYRSISFDRWPGKVFYPYGELICMCRVTEMFDEIEEKLPLALDKLVKTTLQAFRQIPYTNRLPLTKRIQDMLILVSGNAEYLKYLKLIKIEKKFQMFKTNDKMNETEEIKVRGNVYQYPVNILPLYCSVRNGNIEEILSVMNRLLLIVFEEFPQLDPAFCLKSSDFWELVATLSRTPLCKYLLQLAQVKALPWNDQIESKVRSFVMKCITGQTKFGKIYDPWSFIQGDSGWKLGVLPDEALHNANVLNKPILIQMFDLASQLSNGKLLFEWMQEHQRQLNLSKGMASPSEQNKWKIQSKDIVASSKLHGQLEAMMLSKDFAASGEGRLMLTNDQGTVKDMSQEHSSVPMEIYLEASETIDHNSIPSEDPGTSDRQQEITGDKGRDLTQRDIDKPEHAHKECELMNSPSDRKDYQTGSTIPKKNISESSSGQENSEVAANNKKRKMPRVLGVKLVGVRLSHETVMGSDSVDLTRNFNSGRMKKAQRPNVPPCVKKSKNVKCAFVILEQSAAADKMAKTNNPQFTMKVGSKRPWPYRYNPIEVRNPFEHTLYETQQNDQEHFWQPYQTICTDEEHTCSESYTSLKKEEKEKQMNEKIERNKELKRLKKEEKEKLKSEKIKQKSEGKMCLTNEVQGKSLRPRKKFSYCEESSDEEDEEGTSCTDDDNTDDENTDSYDEIEAISMDSMCDSKSGDELLNLDSMHDTDKVIVKLVNNGELLETITDPEGVPMDNMNIESSTYGSFIKQEPKDPYVSVYEDFSGPETCGSITASTSYIPMRKRTHDETFNANSSLSNTVAAGVITQASPCHQTSLTSAIPSLISAEKCLEPMIKQEAVDSHGSSSDERVPSEFCTSDPRIHVVPDEINEKTQKCYVARATDDSLISPVGQLHKDIEIRQESFMTHPRSYLAGKWVDACSKAATKQYPTLGMSRKHAPDFFPEPISQNPNETMFLVPTGTGKKKIVTVPLSVQERIREIQSKEGLAKAKEALAKAQEIGSTTNTEKKLPKTSNRLQKAVKSQSNMDLDSTTLSSPKIKKENPLSSLQQSVQTQPSIPLVAQASSGLQQAAPLQPIVQPTSMIQPLVQTPTSVPHFINTASGLQQLALTSTGMLQFVKTSTGLQPVVQPSSGMQQQIVQPSTGIQQSIVQPSSGIQQQIGQSPSDLPLLVQTSSGWQLVPGVKPSTGTRQVVQPSTGNQQIVQSSTGNQQIVQSSTGNQQIVQPSSGMQQSIVQPSTENQQIVQSSTGNQQIVQPSSGMQLSIVQPSTGNQQIVQSSTGNQQIVQPSSGMQQSIVQPSSGMQQSIVQPSSGMQQSIVQPSTGMHQSIVQPSSGMQQQIGQSPSDLPLLVQTSSGLQLVPVVKPSTGTRQVVQPSSGNQQIVQPSFLNQIVQPSSGMQQAVVQPSSGYQQIVQRSAGMQQSVVQPSSGMQQSVVQPSSSMQQQIVQPSSGMQQSVVQPSSGMQQSVVQPSSGIQQQIVQPPSGIQQQIVQPSSGLQQQIGQSPLLNQTSSGLQPVIPSSSMQQQVAQPRTTDSLISNISAVVQQIERPSTGTQSVVQPQTGTTQNGLTLSVQTSLAMQQIPVVQTSTSTKQQLEKQIPSCKPQLPMLPSSFQQMPTVQPGSGLLQQLVQKHFGMQLVGLTPNGQLLVVPSQKTNQPTVDTPVSASNSPGVHVQPNNSTNTMPATKSSTAQSPGGNFQLVRLPTGHVLMVPSGNMDGQTSQAATVGPTSSSSHSSCHPSVKKLVPISCSQPVVQKPVPSSSTQPVQKPVPSSSTQPVQKPFPTSSPPVDHPINVKLEPGTGDSSSQCSQKVPTVVFPPHKSSQPTPVALWASSSFAPSKLPVQPLTSSSLTVTSDASPTLVQVKQEPVDTDTSSQCSQNILTAVCPPNKFSPGSKSTRVRPFLNLQNTPLIFAEGNLDLQSPVPIAFRAASNAVQRLNPELVQLPASPHLENPPTVFARRNLPVQPPTPISSTDSMNPLPMRVQVKQEPGTEPSSSDCSQGQLMIPTVVSKLYGPSIEDSMVQLPGSTAT